MGALTLKAASIVLPLLKAKKVTPKMILKMLEEILRVRARLKALEELAAQAQELKIGYGKDDPGTKRLRQDPRLPRPQATPEKSALAGVQKADVEKSRPATRRLISMQCGGIDELRPPPELRALTTLLHLRAIRRHTLTDSCQTKSNRCRSPTGSKVGLSTHRSSGNASLSSVLSETVFGAPAYSGQRKSPRLSQGIFARRIRCTRLLR